MKKKYTMFIFRFYPKSRFGIGIKDKKIYYMDLFWLSFIFIYQQHIVYELESFPCPYYFTIHISKTFNLFVKHGNGVIGISVGWLKFYFSYHRELYIDLCKGGTI